MNNKVNYLNNGKIAQYYKIKSTSIKRIKKRSIFDSNPSVTDEKFNALLTELVALLVFLCPEISTLVNSARRTPLTTSFT